MSLRSLSAKLADFAKNHALTDTALRYNPVYYDRAYRLFSEFRSHPEKAAASAEEILARALSRARQTDYGRHRGPELVDWPILSKADVLADPSRFRHPGVTVPAGTSGSTGSPLKLWRSFECVAAEQAYIDSLLGERRAMLERRVAVLRADHVKDPADRDPPFGVWRNRKRKLMLSSAHLSRDTLPWYLETLSSFEPDVLWVYPSSLSNLLRLCEETRTGLSIPIVLSSSEMLSESLFQYAGQSLRARVIDYYGQAERVCSAHCDTIREYRFDPGYGFVELMPEARGNGSNPATARIVATGYWNSAFPLVRYDTGDSVVLPAGSGASDLARIAQGRSAFPELVGRSDDYLVGRDGERITGINHIPRELEAVLRVQVVQDSETRVRALVLPRGEFTERDRNALERNARELLPPYMTFDVTAVDELLSLPNGKTPFIVRNLGEGTEATPTAHP